jgi:predicted transcriptional regulator
VNNRALFLSVKPRFADALLSGRKTVELRKRAPRLPAGATVIIYSSSPTMAVIGTVELEGIVKATPDDVWTTHGHETQVTKAEYDAYFHNSAYAVALRVIRPRHFSVQIPLEVLRKHYGFHPPQSFRYMDEGDLAPWAATPRASPLGSHGILSPDYATDFQLTNSEKEFSLCL